MVSLLCVVFVMVFIGILACDRCNLERYTRGEIEMGIPNVRCGWQRCYRYSGNDKDSPGELGKS